MSTPGDAVPRKPSPGSEEAGVRGCTCPVLDNNHGTSPPWPPDGWWVTAGGCPVHRPVHPEEAARQAS